MGRLALEKASGVCVAVRARFSRLEKVTGRSRELQPYNRNSIPEPSTLNPLSQTPSFIQYTFKSEFELLEGRGRFSVPALAIGMQDSLLSESILSANGF